MNKNIASVISFCTHDARFLRPCLASLRPISSQVLVPVCDHFYDGTPENRELLEAIYSGFPDVEFIEFAYSQNQVYGTPARLVPSSPDWATHWHNSARYIASFFLDPEIEWILFCDVDEIFKMRELIDWLEVFPLENYDAIRFATYWYFQSAHFRATEWPDGPLLVRRSAITRELLLDEDERSGIFQKIEGKKERQVRGLGATPIVDHYSWVRSKEELASKIRSWGHHWERDWAKLIEENKESPAEAGDFVRHYSYEQVESAFDPMKEPLPEGAAGRRRVKKVDAQQIFRLATIELLDRI